MIRPSCSCRERSIPACTGEPPQRRGAVGTCRVYPRVYGGTCCRSCLRSRGSGLSPRVRGNHGSHGRGGSAHGSIPACTGEPPQRRGAVGPCRVYPRVYGGTGHPNARVSCFVGLSPRVRGNRDHPAHCANPDRSIPACTGEPGDRQEAPLHSPVYPRVYGGTQRGARGIRSRWGLSPRVRGNHERVQGLFGLAGSIPACTGEPPSAFAVSFPPRVYPRVYGGTMG